MKVKLSLSARGVATAFVLAAVTAAMAQGAADWKPSKMKATDLGKRVEKILPTFKNVLCDIAVDFTAPDRSDPKGYGIGRAVLTDCFWTSKAFRIQYIAFGQMHEGVWEPPTTEFIATDGKGKTRRLGSLVPAGMTNYSPKQGLFDAKTDGALVEAWPIHFSRLIFSPLLKGNATMSRYLSALSKGVGGYKMRVEERTITVSGTKYKQYRVYAQRPAKGSRVASTVEMIFDDAVWLPVTIRSTYGSKYYLNWVAKWQNNQKLPGDPFRIGVKTKKASRI